MLTNKAQKDVTDINSSMQLKSPQQTYTFAFPSARTGAVMLMCGDVRSWYAFSGLIFQSPLPIHIFADHKTSKREWTMLDHNESHLPKLHNFLSCLTLCWNLQQKKWTRSYSEDYKSRFFFYCVWFHTETYEIISMCTCLVFCTFDQV